MNFSQPNGFGNMPQMPYNNPYPMIPSQSPMNGRTQNNGIIWASEEEAKAYPLAPNSNVSILDRDKNILYLKSCDSMGMCMFKKFAITELEESKAVSVPEPDMSAYVRREEFDELKQLISNIGGFENEKSVSSNNGQSGKQYPGSNSNGSKN